MNNTIHTLQNGLRIILIPVKGSTTATMAVMAATGSRYETLQENGMAHFLEHMLFKGGRKYKSHKKVTETLDSIGGSYNAFTAKDRTAYYAKVPHKHINIAIDVISDIFLHARLPQKDMDRERGAILQEIDMYEDMPMHTVDDVFDEKFFNKDTALARTILGPKKNIKNFRRQEFKQYMQRNYVAKNTVVCISGNFSTEKVLKLVKKEFLNMSDAQAPTCAPAVVAKLKPSIKIKYKKTEQTQIFIGFKAYEYGSPNEYAQLLLTSILSNGMSSRLFIKVREELGLAYSVHAWVESYSDTAYIAIQAGIKHENLHKTSTVILDILKDLKTKPISTKELSKAKELILGHKAMENELTDSLAISTMTNVLMTDNIVSEAKLAKELSKVTVSDIKRVANDIFKSNALTLAAIGPHKNTSKLMKILKEF